jgi:ankyrin repeat protein
VYYGWSSIIAASIYGHVNVVGLLLSKGANINDKDYYGNSAIIAASKCGYVNVTI